MKEPICKALIASGVVESVVIREVVGDGWEIWCHGEAMPAYVRQRLETARGGVRVFASADAAFRVVRRLGWAGAVVLE